MAGIKPSVCPCCNTLRLRREYLNRADGKTPYPNCKYCGNTTKTKPGATRECVTCGKVKQVTKHFCPIRGADRKYIGYTADCRDCRKANDVARLLQSEAARAANQTRIPDAHTLCAEPTNTNNPFNWKTYVQPFQPPPEKWVSTHKTTPTKAQGILL